MVKFFPASEEEALSSELESDIVSASDAELGYHSSNDVSSAAAEGERAKGFIFVFVFLKRKRWRSCLIARGSEHFESRSQAFVDFGKARLAFQRCGPFTI